MNVLPFEKRVQIAHLLIEGNSLRAITRLTGVSINTVTKLLVDLGAACQKYHNENVTGVKSRRVQCDEIWSFVYAKQRNLPKGKDGGDIWTWVGIDADTKLAMSWLVGARETETATAFMEDVAYRLKNRVQLTTDGYKTYLDAVSETFRGNVDFAQLIKMYDNDNTPSHEKRYSSGICTGTIKNVIIGNPEDKYISTSYIERQNLTMRMHIRRFTRLTNGFSMKVENHCFAIALHFMYYNYCKIHMTLLVTPAMEAGLTKDIMELEDLVMLKI